MASSVDAKLLRQTKFPPEFNKKVDMNKVNIEVLKKWIAGKISEILGNEDDVVIELCFNLLEGSRFPDIKVLQIQLTGFLDKDTAKFCKELWSLCHSAQASPQGVPKELLEAKKLELRQEKLDAEKAAEEARRRKEQEMAKDREMENIRERERAQRGRRGGGGGGGWAGRDINRRNDRDSFSPPPRRRSPDPYARRNSRRELDSYVPPGSRKSRWGEDRGRRASRSISRSRVRDLSPSENPRPRRQDDDRSRSRQESINKSSSPVRRDRGRGRRWSPERGDTREKFGTRHDSESSSRSRSPRRRRRRSRSSPSRSPYLSSPRRHRRRARDPDSMSRSPSRSPSRSRSPPTGGRGGRRGRRNRSPSYDATNIKKETRADSGKAHKSRDDRRLSRSRERTSRRHPRSRSRSGRRIRTRSPSADRNRSHSRSPGSRKDRRRRRSIERYAPAARRQREGSSVSLPNSKRQKTADLDEASTSRSPTLGRLPDDIGDKATSPEAVGNEVAESVEKD